MERSTRNRGTKQGGFFCCTFAFLYSLQLWCFGGTGGERESEYPRPHKSPTSAGQDTYHNELVKLRGEEGLESKGRESGGYIVSLFLSTLTWNT